jgi:hypothetical protein
MEADTIKAIKIEWGGVGNLLRESRLSIEHRHASDRLFRGDRAFYGRR